MDPRIEQIIDAIVRTMSPLAIWLFGSRAEQRERPDSDWDLLVVLPDETSVADLDPIAAWRRFGGLGVPVDVVPCTQSEFEEERFEPDSLPAAAWKRGRCLYERHA